MQGRTLELTNILSILKQVHFNMKLLLNFIYLVQLVAGNHRNARSCSSELKTVFSSLIRQDQVIVNVPREEHRNFSQPFPNFLNLLCNHAQFFRRITRDPLKHYLVNLAKFLIPLYYSSPIETCHTIDRKYYIPNKITTLRHPPPNCKVGVFFMTPGFTPRFRIKHTTRNQTRPFYTALAPEAATLITYALASFFERHTFIRWQLHYTDHPHWLRKEILPCYLPLT